MLLLTHLFHSVTITSILRVTAVANSAHNQADQTWNFITRGVWTLIEANLGIICTCLPVLKQLIKRVFPSIFSTTKATPNSNPYAYGTKTSNSRRDARSRLPDDPDDDEVVDELGYESKGYSAVNKHRSYRLASLPYGRKQYPEDERRKSDEKHIMTASDARTVGGDASIEGNDKYDTSWLADSAGSGITITRTVDVHVASSKPNSRGK